MSDYHQFEVDLGYAITESGDVVTADGLPRGNLDAASWPQIFGKPLAFRKPTPAEKKDFYKVDDALMSSFKAFTEMVLKNDKPR